MTVDRSALPVSPSDDDVAPVPVIATEQLGSHTVLCRPRGDLDFAMSMELRHVVSGLLQRQVDLVIDLGEVGEAGALGSSAVVGAVRWARHMGGRAEVRNANPRVAAMLDLFAQAERRRPGADRFGQSRVAMVAFTPEGDEHPVSR